MKFGHWIKLICFSIFLLPFNSWAQPAKNGFVDLSSYNFKKDGQLTLSGEWEFYWNRLLTPADFKTNQHLEWIHVPGSWHKETKHPVTGYATYRLRVLLPAHQDLSLYFPVINSSAKVWINGTVAIESGTVGKNSQSYKPKLGATILSLPNKERDVEIIIQVANFTYFSSGIVSNPQLDTTSEIFSSVTTRNGIEIFFAGSLFAMFVYQFILYFLYRRGTPYLWLSLICLGVALRAMIVHGGSFLLPNLFSFIDWEYWKKLEFGCVYGIVALFPLYVRDLFPEYSPKKPIRFFIGIAIFLLAVVVFTPQHIYGRFLEVAHIALLLGFIYAVYSIRKAWRANNADARIIFFGVLASFPFILTEILKNSLLYPLNMQFMYLVELGVLVFLLFQVYLLANHYAKSYKNLEIQNQDLEKVIQERTGQLITANTVKDRLLSVISHDIKSPLNSLKGILQIYNRGSINKDEFAHFSQQLENDLGKTTMLVENILYWTANQLKGIQVKFEKFDLCLLMNENIKLFETVALNKKIVLRHNTPKDFVIDFDRNILNLVLRNLISNAIKFSYEGGEISINTTATSNSVLIQVKDRGVGMDENTIQSLLNPKMAVSTAGTTQEKGTGLGLSLCKDYLQKAGGLLSIDSVKGKGSTFNLVIPA